MNPITPVVNPPTKDVTFEAIQRMLQARKAETPEPPPPPGPEPIPEKKRNLFLEVYDRAIARREERIARALAEENGKLASVRKWMLRMIAIFASLSCASASVYFSNRYLAESQPPIIAMVMAVTIVATLTVAPELSSVLLRRRRPITAVVTFAISLVATGFSMIQTVGGIYNSKTESLQQESVVIDPAALAAREEVAVLKPRVDRLYETLKTEQAAQKTYNQEIEKALAEGEATDSTRMRLLVANRNAAITRAMDAEAGIRKAEDRISELLKVSSELASQESSRVVRNDFSLWLGERVGLTQESMEFILAVFPAVFIDVISPVMLLVAFSL